MEKWDTPDIGAITFDCQSMMIDLLVAAEHEACCVKKLLHSRDVQQTQDRLNQWAGNVGALQPFDSSFVLLLSLERRLRDAPLIRKTFLRTPTDLHYSIRSGKTPFARPSNPLII